MQGRLKHVPIPDNIWSAPGHYSVIGLLPDDHTYAKGSLFIIKPGTKAVVFDVDGVVHPARSHICAASSDVTLHIAVASAHSAVDWRHARSA